MSRTVEQIQFAPRMPKPLRVAAYARVSSGKDAMLHSLAAQVDHYSTYIRHHHGWEYVGVYADEAKTGTRDSRENFQRMLTDCRAGKIDLIVTKSVSRFARNTVDSLTTIRKLKEAGCECFFQKENIMTFDSKGELLITIMSSLAQEESRSISENVTWGQRKRFSDGKVSIPYGQFLGYRKGADGLPEIVPEEAETVRRIYREFLQGKSTNAIATMLTEECIPTPGKKAVWQRATVESILRNEKYKGSALLQKSFTVDFLTKKTMINEGEVPQYYVEDSHPAIIEPWEWEQVQVEMERRKNSRNRHHQTSPFSGKIICADCGDIFGAKTWHSTDRYRRVIWQCNGKFKGERKCETPHLTEERLKELYLDALGEYLSDRDAAIDQLRYVGPPKTGQPRAICLSPETIGVLKEYRTEQLRTKIRHADIWQDTGFLFTKDDGTPMHPDSITDWLNKFSEENDLPHIHPHAFRHTAASMMIANGVDLVNAAAELGHATASTTLNIYAHQVARARAEASGIRAGAFAVLRQA